VRVLGLIAIFFVIFSGFLGSNNGQYAEAQKPQDSFKVLLQLQVRNSDGQLVAYIEGTKILTIKEWLLNNYLDTLPNKKTVTDEGKKYELFQWQGKTEKFDKTHSMALFQLHVNYNDQMVMPLLVNHNAYQVQEGDTVTVFWTIMRSVS